MKQFYQIALGLAIFSFFLTPNTQATHFMGGDFSVECLGNGCTYRVYFTGYLDCGSPLTNPTFTINGTLLSPPPGCAAPNPVNPAWLPANYTEVTPICPGLATNCTNPNAPINGVVEVMLYQDYDFCSTSCTTGVYTLSYTTCCRNASLTNGGANAGFYLSTELDFGQTPCNNSPDFNSPGVSYLCADTGGMIDFSATDPDGDSLTYSLVSCFSTGPAIPITYNPGYSATNPFGTDWNMSFDTQTGLMTLLPNPVGAAGVYQVCVKVSEYRNGNYLGSVTRDMQVMSTTCTNGSFPVYDSILSISGGTQVGPANIQVCVGDSLSFTFAFSDADTSDLICISSNVDQVLDGATLTTNCVNPATGTLSWVPDSSDNGKTYTFYAQAQDDQCPIPAKAYQVFYVSVGGACLTGTATNTACNDSTGSIDITFSGGTAPYSYLWNTGATTEDLTNLPIGKYWVDVTDALGLVVSDTFYVSASDLLLNPILNPLTCNNPNAAIGLNPSGGTAPYTFQWNTGQSSSTIGGLTAGGYSVIVTDSAGCFHQEVFILDEPDSCFVSIEGTVFDDANGNCVQDAGEIGLPFVLVDIAPGWATFTDANGHYYLEADTGSHLLTVLPGSFMSPLCPVSGSHSLYFADYNDDTTGVDFAMDFLEIQDLRLDIFNFVAVPGITRFNQIKVFNDGSIAMDGTVKVQYDPWETYFSSPVLPTVNNPATQELEWDFSQLAPGSSLTFTFFTQVDSSAIADSIMKTFALVEPIAGDTTPANNADTTCAVVLTSYDPNDKQVEPTGIREPGYILASQNVMTYTVRFQNTGTYPAQYVEIRDTLGPALNPFSFRPGSYSHPYTLNLEDDSVLVFTFANINLPDSASDPLGSQGHVSFYLHHEGTLSPGTKIENSAAIYFDFNAPVITNKTLNTIFEYPQVNLNQIDSLCLGDELTAMMTEVGMPPYAYVWSTGDQGNANNIGVFGTQVDSSGWYQLTVTDAFGFETVDSLQLAVLEEPMADFSFDALAGGYEFAFQDLSTDATEYLWDFGDGNSSTSASPSHVFANAGPYSVSLTVSNDCGSSTQSITLTVTNLEQDLFARSVQVIPNPFSQSTEISFDNTGSRSFKLTLYDAKGKVVRQFQDLRSSSLKIDREELAPGLYLFHLEGPQQFMGKLVVR